MNLSKQGPAVPSVQPTFPECDNYEVQNIDWRDDRFAIFNQAGCVVSGLSYHQTASLMSHFKSLEGK